MCTHSFEIKRNCHLQPPCVDSNMAIHPVDLRRDGWQTVIADSSTPTSQRFLQSILTYSTHLPEIFEQTFAQYLKKPTNVTAL